MIIKKTTKQLKEERPSPESLKSLPRTPISVVADNIRSLDNIGLLFRLCEVARVERLYITGYSGHPRIDHDERQNTIIERHERRIEKTAVYALPYQPWEYHENPIPLVESFKKHGHKIIALEQTEQSIPYHTVLITDYRLPITLLVGHERQGVRQELLDLADQIIEIPILGLGNSHNVAISTAIVLYHILEKTGPLSNS